MKEIIKNLKVGLTIGVGFVVMVFLAGIVYGAWTNISSLKVNSNDLLSSSIWNEAMDNFELLRNSQSVPAGLVSAFNLDACPNGWLPANGSGSIMDKDIPDLRGRFIRGMGGNENGEDEVRTLGSIQNDQIRRMLGGGTSMSPNVGFASYGAPFYRGGKVGKITGDSNTGYQMLFDSGLLGEAFNGSDTHPKNIALIYCVKE